MSGRRRITYRAAGVDLALADRWVQDLRRVVRSTRRPEVVGELEGFGGLFQLDGGRYLVASADGAGTKVKLAQWAGRHTGIGVDAVAMNVNDILTFGAAPLFVLDYLAMGRLDRRIMGALVRGVALGCRESGAALLGGETAEMPGCYGPGEYDIAAFAVGIVDRRQLVDGRSVRRGDVVVGLASSGVHSNGFSLVRRVWPPARLRRDPALLRRLLIPTRIYVRQVLAAQRVVRLKAMAHITGGGLARRLPSLVAHARGRCAVQLRPRRWTVPAVLRAVQRAGHLADEEMERTFNMGIGFAIVCAARDASRLQRALRGHRMASWIIGDIV